MLFIFFFNDTATTEIYTLSLHDALPISRPRPRPRNQEEESRTRTRTRRRTKGGSWRGRKGRVHRKRRSKSRFKSSARLDRKSTRLNSSHTVISYAVFCLKKKKNNKNRNT